MQEQTSTAPAVARDELIEQHRPYARALAAQISRTLPQQVDFNDLVAYGHVGLIEAAERFDPRRGVSFQTFAHYRIKGAIYDGLRDMGYYARTPSREARFAANANDVVRAASDDERAAAQGTPAAASLDDEIDSTQSLINALIPVYLLSLEDEAVPEMVDPHAISVEKFEERELIGFVLNLVRELSAEEQQLINAIYFKHTSMTHLAEQMGVTKSWVSRLHSRAIQHLRDRMRERGLFAEED